MKLTAITGGIGSGKSVVSKILRIMGYEVYDCDSRAKALMDNSPTIKQKLQEEFGADVVVDGHINRPLLAKIVFNDKACLSRLNSIVHEAVRADLRHWAKQCAAISDSFPGCNQTAPRSEKLLFVETAILYQSGLDKMVDCVWEVDAPERIRLLRAMRRDGADEAAILGRIRSQQFQAESPHPNTIRLLNDDLIPLLPQILSLIPHGRVLGSFAAETPRCPL